MKEDLVEISKEQLRRLLDIRDLKNKNSKYKNKELEDLINSQYLNVVTDLMNIIYSILNESPFCFLFEDNKD